METSKLPKMTLYQYPHNRSFRVLWLMYELGVGDEIKVVTMAHDGSPEHMEYKKNVHPHGSIPALAIEGGEVIVESGAICLYLADLYGKLAPPLDKRNAYYNWSMYASVTIDEIVQVLYTQWVLKHKPDPEGVDRMLAKCDVAMTYLSNALKDRTFICGEEFTAADCILGFCTSGLGHEIFKNGCCLEKFPVVRKYTELMEARPAYQAAMAAQDVRE